MTSTSIYNSPSNRPYVLCTTSPSSERHYNNGEWSFSLPLPSTETPSSSTPRWRPPSNTIHNFEQFKRHDRFRAGAVSNKHNVFAVLEDNGRISTLPLTAGAQGGICGPPPDESEGGGSTFLSKSIGKVGGCLRFTPDGERLVAVDAEGKVVVAEFEKDE